MEAAIEELVIGELAVGNVLFADSRKGHAFNTDLVKNRVSSKRWPEGYVELKTNAQATACGYNSGWH